MPDICQQARITGTVQGVAYRAWTEGQARQLGLTGWVRNQPDGSVTALICGPREMVERMVTALWQGPGAARVRDVQTDDVDPAAAPEDFTVRR